MRVIQTILFSIVASAAATYLLRQILSAQAGAAPEGAPGEHPNVNTNVNVVLMPIIIGNTGASIRRGKHGKHWKKKLKK